MTIHEMERFNVLVDLCKQNGVSFNLFFSETEDRWEVGVHSAAVGERFMTGDRPRLLDTGTSLC